METFQTWFAPILYFIAAAGGILGFYKQAIKPISDMVKKIQNNDSFILNEISKINNNFSKIEESTKLIFNQQTLLTDATLSLLRDRLLQGASFHLNKGFITLEDLENVEALFKTYFSLGGNGFIGGLINQIRNLPIPQK